MTYAVGLAAVESKPVLKIVLITATVILQTSYQPTQVNTLFDIWSGFIEQLTQIEKTFKTVAINHSATAPLTFQSSF